MYIYIKRKIEQLSNWKVWHKGYDIFDCWFYYTCTLFVIYASRSEKVSLNYNWIVLVRKRTFDVTNFFKKGFSLIWVHWAVDFLWIVVSICRRQLQNGSRKSWKLSLNLCSREWLSPTRNLVNSLIPWGLCSLNELLGLGLINLRICLLKVLTDCEFRILLSSLFHSTTVDWKKEFRKYSCLTFNKGMLLQFLVVCVDFGNHIK